MLTFPCSSQHLLLLCFALLLLCFASQAFYLATSVTLLSFFVALRNQQPFKFRDVKAVSILTATVVTLFILSVMLGNSGGTFHAVPGVIAMFCGRPLVSYYYIMKNLQLYYLEIGRAHV